MARGTNYLIICALCGAELPYQRLMEQSPVDGRLRSIVGEVGLLCEGCAEELPEYRPPQPRERERVGGR